MYVFVFISLKIPFRRSQLFDSRCSWFRSSWHWSTAEGGISLLKNVFLLKIYVCKSHQDVDVSILGYFITVERLRIMDFAVANTEEPYTLLVPYPKEKSPLLGPYRPFQSTVGQVKGVSLGLRNKCMKHEYYKKSAGLDNVSRFSHCRHRRLIFAIHYICSCYE